MEGKVITDVVKAYLKKKYTDYAIMIDGVWGSGKTFYVENDLVKAIKEIDCKNTEPVKKYNPIIFSLYGAKSAEDIQLEIKRKIKLSDNDPDNKKKRGLPRSLKPKTETAIATIVGGFAEYFGIDSKRLITLFNLIPIPKNVVLILDDMERSGLSSKEVLSIVNYYAERENIKVIIICNETKEDSEYKQFKEKTIRYTLHYSPSTEEIFDSIVNKLLQNKPPRYKSFIESNKSLILEIFYLGECNNLRTLIFVLDIFDKVFEEISKCQFEDEFCKGFLSFACIYSIEYKSGANDNDLVWLSSHSTLNTTITIFDIARGGYENSYEEKNPFIEKLTQYGDYLKTSLPSEAIAHYIHYGEFDKDTFEKEQKKIEEEYIELRKTEYGQCLIKMMDWKKIEDTGLDELLSQVVEFLKQGKYSPKDISILYARYLELKMNNIFCQNVNDEIFFEAVDKQKNHWSPIYEDELYEWKRRDNSYDSMYEELKKHIIDINKDYLKRQDAEGNEELMNIIRRGELNKYKQYTKRIDSQQFLSLPIDELWEAISHTDKDIQHLFVTQMEQLFPLKTDRSEEGRRLRNYVENIISSGNYQENAILRMDPTIFTFSLTEKPTEDGKIIPLYALLDDTGGEKKVDVKACFYVFDGKDN